MNTILFGCGGTGNRVITTTAYWLATNPKSLAPLRMYPMSVDFDTTGAARKDSLDIVRRYSEIVGLMEGSGIFPGMLGQLPEDYNQWQPRPVEGGYTLWKTLYNPADDSGVVAKAGFLEAELHQDISTGTFGRGALASVLLKAQIDPKAQVDPKKGKGFWDSFKTIAGVSDAHHFILAASTFGGTGPSTLPSLIDWLRDKFPAAKISTVLMLPYYTFNFSKTQKDDAAAKHQLLPDPTMFVSNAVKEVLQAYFETSMPKVDYTYLIGDPNPSGTNLSDPALAAALSDERLGIVPGGDKQKTPMFFHDFLAGEAVLDAERRSRETKDRSSAGACFVAGVDLNKLGWSQFPKTVPFEATVTGSEAMATLARFAYLTRRLVEPFVREGAGAEAQYRQAPFLADLSRDPAGLAKWRALEAFMKSFSDDLIEMEITSRTGSAPNGYINLPAWTDDLKSTGPGGSAKTPTEIQEMAKRFDGAVKERTARSKSLMDTWNAVCKRLDSNEPHRELARRIYDIARAK